MDDWHLSLSSQLTDIEIIQEIEDADFKDGESAMKAAQELLGGKNLTFFIVCRYTVTKAGVERDEGFTSGQALMKIAPDKMINFYEKVIMEVVNQNEGLVEMNGIDLL